jgi:hypothetical protein
MEMTLMHEQTHRYSLVPTEYLHGKTDSLHTQAITTCLECMLALWLMTRMLVLRAQMLLEQLMGLETHA